MSSTSRKTILRDIDNILMILSLHTINDEPKCMKMQLEAAFKEVQKLRDTVEEDMLF